MREPTRTFELIELLCRHRVEFIVVGMTSAVLQGTPALTFDLDIVYVRDEDNVTRLLQVLGAIGALFRNDPRKIPVQLSHPSEHASAAATAESSLNGDPRSARLPALGRAVLACSAALVMLGFSPTGATVRKRSAGIG